MRLFTDLGRLIQHQKADAIRQFLVGQRVQGIHGFAQTRVSDCVGADFDGPTLDVTVEFRRDRRLVI
jgi:hypothetical protein